MSDEAEARASFADWKRLDLDPGSDERSARVAYARQLKLTRPEVDAEAFQALREAYERVLEDIRNPAGQPAAPHEAAADTVDPAAVARAVHAMACRRRRGDSAGALASLDGALAGTLRLQWRHAVEDALLADIAGDPSLRPDLLRGLADRFDWREATGRHASDERMGPLRERIQSADYVVALRERVAAARAGEGAPGDDVLVTIFGPYKPGLFDRVLAPSQRAVAEEVIGAFFEHADIDTLYDPRMLAALRSALGAAPLMKEPPTAVAEPAGQAERTALTPVRDPNLWDRVSNGHPKWIWIGLVLFFLRFSSLGSHNTATTSYAPEAVAPSPTIAMPTLPTSLDLDQQSDGRRVLHLGPFVEGSRFGVRALRIVTEPDGNTTEIEVPPVVHDPDFVLPQGTAKFSLQFVLRDGGQGDIEEFDLSRVTASGDVTANSRR